MTIDPAVVLTIITALAAGIGGIARLVYGDLRRDRDFWRDRVLTALDNADEALEVAAAKGKRRA